MPSANKTENYGLNQWQGNEYPKREDFNSDNLIIDTQLKNVNDKADGKINKSLATAASQFLVSSAAGQWAIKTIAEIKTLLGLGTAAEKNFNTAGGVASYDTVNTHLSDYVRQPGYGVTAGSANTYALTLSPSPSAYTDGMGIVVKINAANTGAATINVNGLGVKPIVDGKGNALTSGKLRLNGTYSLKYNTTSGNFILQGSDSSGNATPADLLAGKTASVDAGDIIGTMANYAGTLQNPYGIESPGGGQILVHPKPGYYDSAGNIALYDPDFVAANIVNGKEIFGVTGSFAGKRWAKGTIVPTGYTSVPFTDIAGSTGTWFLPLTISGLTFKPTKIVIRTKFSEQVYYTIYEDTSEQTNYQKVVRVAMFVGGSTSNVVYSIKGDVAPASVTSTGFTLPIIVADQTYIWEAYE